MRTLFSRWTSCRKTSTKATVSHTDTFDNKAQIANWLGDSVATCNRLKISWTTANSSIKWTVQVFNASTGSKSLYMLQCIQLTGAAISKLDAFKRAFNASRDSLHISR